MVIQDDNEAPAEVSVMKTPQLEGTKYVIIKNHVRELPITEHASPGHSSAQDDSSENEKSAKKPKKSSKKNEKVIDTPNQEKYHENVCKHTDDLLRVIDKKFEELRNEILKCFDKFRDDIEQTIYSGPSTHRNIITASNSEEECHCKVNTKIIFDEDGQQSVKEPTLDSHVCPNKLKRKYSDVAKNVDIHSIVMKRKYSDVAKNLDIHSIVMAQKSKVVTRSLAVEYEEQSITLPEDLPSLTNILKDSDIAISYRNKVINKVKSIKQEHLNEIRFSRPSMIEKLKSNDSSEVFEFKGANLFTLPGYPDWQ